MIIDKNILNKYKTDFEESEVVSSDSKVDILAPTLKFSLRLNSKDSIKERVKNWIENLSTSDLEDLMQDEYFLNNSLFKKTIKNYLDKKSSIQRELNKGKKYNILLQNSQHIEKELSHDRTLIEIFDEDFSYKAIPNRTEILREIALYAELFEAVGQKIKKANRLIQKEFYSLFKVNNYQFNFVPDFSDEHEFIDLKQTMKREDNDNLFLINKLILSLITFFNGRKKYFNKASFRGTFKWIPC